MSLKKTETALNTSAGSKGVGRERDIHPPTHLSSKRVAAGRLADSGASERGGTRLPPLPLLSGELRRYLAKLIITMSHHFYFTKYVLPSILFLLIKIFSLQSYKLCIFVPYALAWDTGR